MAPLLLALREAEAPVVLTLASHAASRIQDGHAPEDILHVLLHPKSQDGDAQGVKHLGAFTAVAGAAASVRVFVAMKAATDSSASTATFTATNSTGLRNLCCQIKLDSHRLRATGGW